MKSKKSKQPKDPNQPSQPPKSKKAYGLSRRHQHALVAKIHEEIRSGKYPNARQMAVKFEVSKSTIDRNIKFLRSHHNLPLEYDNVKNGFYYSGPVEDILKVPLTTGDIFTLVLAQRALLFCCGTKEKELVLSGFKKLAALLPEEMMVNVEDLEDTVSFHSSIEPIYDRKIFMLFMKAARKGQQLNIHYHTPTKEPGWRIVDPYAFQQVGTEWYLFAKDHNRNKIVKFMPQRTLAAEKTGVIIERPKDFSVKKFLEGSFGVFSAEGNFDVVIRFAKNVAHRAREKRWPGQKRIEEMPDGGVELHLHLTSLVEVHAWLLGFDGDAWPVGPVELVEKFRCAIQKMQGRMG